MTLIDFEDTATAWYTDRMTCMIHFCLSHEWSVLHYITCIIN